MEKRILLIGNSDGLPGVKVDIFSYKKFFKSQRGGNWLDGEIIEKVNVSRDDLDVELRRLKGLSLDYLVVIFSGHGGQKRETILEINAQEEVIGESDLKNISQRQLNIFDCCRSFLQPQPTYEVRNLSESIKNFSFFSTREKYERRILQAIPQQVSLYACAIGECAHDTTEGGAYSKHLLRSSLILQGEYKLIGSAHEEASVATTREFADQHPDSVLPRCLSTQQLIISINPNL